MTGVLHRTVAVALWGLVIVVVGAIVGEGTTAGQDVSRAGLVVDFGDGRVETSCVEFAGDEISGAELLRRSGLGAIFSGFGGGLGDAVCQIDGTGCSDPGDCFCQCRGADCVFWQYHSLANGAWQFEVVGPSSRRLRDGGVDGWSWGLDGAPPALTFADICPVLPAPPIERPPPPEPPAADEPADAPRSVAPGALAQEPSSSAPPDEQPARANGEPTAGASTPRAAEEPTTVREVAGRVDAPDADGDVAVPEASVDDGDSSAVVPASLIAFGAVAGALGVAAIGLGLRRRFGG